MKYLELKGVNPIEDMLKFEPQLVKEVEGKEIKQHYCFSCGQKFPLENIEWCPICGWARCPLCGCCACMLSDEAQMAVRGVWLTFCVHCNNPCPGKGAKRGGKRSPQEIDEYVKRIEADPKLDSATKKRFIERALTKQRD